MNAGYRNYPKTEGEIRTDDAVDALAGSCFNCLQVDQNRLPYSRLVNLGITPSSNSRNWQSMSGMSYGYGPGGQVFDRLKKVSSYPK
jgi:hypothetical protein